MIDLDHLEKLHAEKLKDLEATTWGDEDGEYEAAVVRVLDVSSFSETEDIGDGSAYEFAVAAAQEAADAAVECINALPALIAELRLARAELHVSRRNTRESEWAIENANRGLQESSVRIVALEKERNHYQHEAEVEFAERKRIAEASDRAIIAATEKTLEHLEARMRAETQRDEAMAIADRWKSQAALATTVGDITVRNSTDATKLDALHAEVRALRSVAEAARAAYESRHESMLAPVRMNDLGHALAKVPRPR